MKSESHCPDLVALDRRRFAAEIAEHVKNTYLVPFQHSAANLKTLIDQNKGQLKYWSDCLRYATAEDKLWLEAKVARCETQLAEWETELAAREKSEFAARLRGSRKDAKLTQLQLSAKSGVSVRAIKDAESGKSTPQKKNREALAGALRIDPALL